MPLIRAKHQKTQAVKFKLVAILFKKNQLATLFICALPTINRHNSLLEIKLSFKLYIKKNWFANKFVS